MGSFINILHFCKEYFSGFNMHADFSDNSVLNCEHVCHPDLIFVAHIKYISFQQNIQQLLKPLNRSVSFLTVTTALFLHLNTHFMF